MVDYEVVHESQRIGDKERLKLVWEIARKIDTISITSTPTTRKTASQLIRFAVLLLEVDSEICEGEPMEILNSILEGLDEVKSKVEALRWLKQSEI